MMKDKRKAVGLEGKGIAKIFVGSIGFRNVVMAHDTKKRQGYLLVKLVPDVVMLRDKEEQQGCLLVKALKMEVDTMNF